MTNRAASPLAQYAAPFRLLVRDLEQILEYVHPADGNEHVFSYRLYNLLLRASTEFESVCKDACFVNGIELKPLSTIRDYALLADKLEIKDYRVGLTTWHPKTRFIQPLQAWERGEYKLSWYADYNAVKHNRLAEFHRASLENVLYALGALFLLLVKHAVFQLAKPSHIHHQEEDMSIEFLYRDLPFTLRLKHSLDWVQEQDRVWD